MPSVVWPASLPEFPLAGVEENAEPNVVTTEVGSGPPKSRRRSTRERKFQTGQIELTGAQLATFEAFWLNINQGATTFEWTDMITGETAEFRFVEKPRPRQIVPALLPTKRLYALPMRLERVN